MTPVEMPKANENLTEATLNLWLVKEGDRVEKDGALCEIITDKATFQMPSPCAGTVLKRLAPERSVLPVGYVMCVVGEPSDTVPADLAAKNEAILAAHRQTATAIVSTATATGSAAPAAPVTGAGVRATPAARRMAKEAGLNLADVVKQYNLTAPVNEHDVKRYLDEKK
jgi:pyruvate/2-oxoglutarate dehydrogenase complex dihydrolipoamide acyltransferase (E2) component